MSNYSTVLMNSYRQNAAPSYDFKHVLVAFNPLPDSISQFHACTQTEDAVGNEYTTATTGIGLLPMIFHLLQL